jgi:16S rRNA (adenine1518-N6/adenine1519-N6)-dimethyltransferase
MNQIVTRAFSLRRKTMRNSLKRFLDSDDFVSLAIDPQARAENLSLNDYIAITDYLKHKAQNEPL